MGVRVVVVVVAGLIGTHSAVGQSSANTGPGGVGNNVGTSSLVVWLAIDRDVNSFFNAITHWPDQSGYGNHAFQDDNFRPFLASNVVNGFPSARFYGSSDFLTIKDNSSIDLTQWSFFMVAKANEQKDFNTFFSKGPHGAENFEFLSTATGALQTPIYYTNTTRSNDNYDVGMSNTFRIYQYDYNNARLTYNVDLRHGYDRVETLVPQVNTFPMLIGSEGGAANKYLNGDITEFIAYNNKVNLAQQIIISNYLAAKYGLTLSISSEVYTMDDPANGDYDFEVAGIGQASDGSSQQDSRGSDIVRVAVENPATMTNEEFFMWGRDYVSTANSHVFHNSDVDGKITLERLRRVWRVSEAGDVGPVAISFDISSFGTTPDGANLLLLVDRDDDGFADNDVTPQGGGTYVGKTITFSGVNLRHGDRFTLGNTNIAKPLPIELLSFTAAPEGTAVKFTWSTASELNNDYFVVQHSVDGETWEDVVTEKGAGDKSTRTNYEGTDNRAHLGTSYYRIKQVDRDGKYSYSQIKRVEVAEKLGLRAYPNPVTSGSFHVVTGFEIEAEHIQLVDMMGKPLPLKIFKDDEEGVLVETINPSPGVYVLQVVKGYWKQYMRVVIR